MQRTWNIRGAVMAILVLGVMLGAQFGMARAQGARPELETATAAKAILVKMDRAKIQTIRDARMRADLLAGYDALKAVADNTSAARETVLLAKLHKTALKLKANNSGPTPTPYHNVDECVNAPCPLGPKMCQIQLDGCIDMIRFWAYFPPGAPG